MEFSRTRLKALSWLVRLQFKNWKSEIRYELRFLLCGLFSYLSFSAFDMLKDLLKDKQTEFINLFFTSFGEALLGLLIIVIAYVALYFSIIAAALFTTLVPMEKQDSIK